MNSKNISIVPDLLITALQSKPKKNKNISNIESTSNREEVIVKSRKRKRELVESVSLSELISERTRSRAKK